MEKENVVTLIDAFKDFKEEKNIDRPVMMGVLKDVFMTQIAKTYGSSDNFDVIVNVDKGTCEIYQNFEIVEEVENPNTQMTPEQVAEETGDDDYEVGDTYTKELSLKSFGRRGILNIRQNLQGRIMDIEKANVYKKYSEKVGEIFSGEVYQTWSKEVLILDEDGNELHIPKEEQIPGERFKKNDTVRAIIKSVEMRNNTTPYIILSRTSNEFLERLFEQEVPEILDGLITVKKVVRVPGERAKVAVESYDERIDPIGACIGVKGGRIIGIVRELRNENIDVIQWTNNQPLLIQRALNPARVSSIDMGSGPNDKVMDLGDICAKYEAFGWETITVDGHDVDAITEALKRPTSGKPRFICCNTIKGKGVSFMENQVGWHGKPMDQAAYETAIRELEV